MSLGMIILAVYIAGIIFETYILCYDIEGTKEIANKVWHKPSRLKMSFMLSLVVILWPMSAIVRIYENNK